GRAQGASSHTLTDLEPWAAPGVCPAHEQTCAKSTIFTAARNSKQVDNRLAVFWRRLRQPRHVGQFAFELFYQVWRNLIAPIADRPHARHPCLGHQMEGYRVTLRIRCASAAQ